MPTKTSGLRLLLFLLLASAGTLLGQGGINSGGSNPVRFGANLPATCTPGGAATSLFFRTTAGPVGTLYICSAPNTWSATSAGGGTCTALGGDLSGTCVLATVIQIEGGAIPLNAGALGTNASGQLISVPASGGNPSFPANQPVSGLGVEYVSGLTFSVGAGTYTIGGTQYTSALTSVTLTTADMTNPRIDVIIASNAGIASAIAGTAAATPTQPAVDYSTQLPLQLVLVPAGSSTPGTLNITNLYLENTEWTCASSSNINCASTSNPYTGTKDVEATAAVLGNNFTLVKPASGTTDLSTQSNLIFYIRSKATWPSANNTGANGIRTLSLFWLNGSTQVGVQVVLKDGNFGFSSSQTSTYQQISIPLSQFSTGSNLVTTLKAQVTGNGGTSSFGWYIDQVTLQAGVSNLPVPTVFLNSDQHLYPAANCVSATAGSAWSLPAASTFTAACRAGSNNLNGTLQATPSTGATAYFQFQLPNDWVIGTQPFIKIYYASGANTSGTVIWTLSTGCTKSDGSLTDDPAFVAEAAMGTQTMAVANRTWAQSAQFTKLTSANNCIGGSIVDLKLVLSGTAGSAINAMYATINVPRNPVVQAN